MRIFTLLALLLVLTTTALAQDWTADRLRGSVEINTGTGWQHLHRGDTVLDGQSVRTGPDGRVELLRDAERVSLEPDTLILLREGVGKMTTIIQSSGALTADVERRNVQHFSVQTPILAAIVKGTRFRVEVADGQSSVSVERGTVQVQDTVNDLVTNILPGQSAQVADEQPLIVSGRGEPAVFTFIGDPVTNGTTTPGAASLTDERDTTTPAMTRSERSVSDRDNSGQGQDRSWSPLGAGNGSAKASQDNNNGNGNSNPSAGPGNNNGNGHGNGGGNPDADSGNTSDHGKHADHGDRSQIAGPDINNGNESPGDGNRGKGEKKDD